MILPFFHAPLESSLNVKDGYGAEFDKDYYCRIPRMLKFTRDSEMASLYEHSGKPIVGKNEPLYDDNHIVLHGAYTNKFKYKTTPTTGPNANQEIDAVRAFSLNKTTDPNKPLYTTIGRDVEKYTVMNRDEYKTAPRNGGDIFDHMLLDPVEDVHLDIIQHIDQFLDDKKSGSVNFSFYFKADIKAKIEDVRYLFIHIPIEVDTTTNANGDPGIDFVTVTLRVENNKVTYVQDGDSSLGTDTGQFLSRDLYLPESYITLQTVGDFTRVGIQFDTEYDHFRCFIRFSHRSEQSFNGYMPQTPPDTYYFWGWQITSSGNLLPYVEESTGATQLEIPMANMQDVTKPFKISFDLVMPELSRDARAHIMYFEESPARFGYKTSVFAMIKRANKLSVIYDNYDANPPPENQVSPEGIPIAPPMYDLTMHVEEDVPEKLNFRFEYNPVNKTGEIYINEVLQKIDYPHLMDHEEKNPNYTTIYVGDFRVPEADYPSKQFGAKGNPFHPGTIRPIAFKISNIKIYHENSFAPYYDDYLWLPMECNAIPIPTQAKPILSAELKTSLLTENGFVSNYKKIDQYIKPQYLVFRRDSMASSNCYTSTFGSLEKDVPDMGKDGLFIHPDYENLVKSQMDDYKNTSLFNFSNGLSPINLNTPPNPSDQIQTELKIKEDIDPNNPDERAKRFFTWTPNISFKRDEIYNVSFYIRSKNTQNRKLHVIVNTGNDDHGAAISPTMIVRVLPDVVKAHGSRAYLHAPITSIEDQRDGNFYRISFSIKHRASTPTFTFKLLEEISDHDENEEFAGSNGPGGYSFGIWGFQITRTASVMPYIEYGNLVKRSCLMIPLTQNIDVASIHVIKFKIKCANLATHAESNIFSILHSKNVVAKDGKTLDGRVAPPCKFTDWVYQNDTLIGNDFINAIDLDTDYKYPREVYLSRVGNGFKYVFNEYIPPGYDKDEDIVLNAHNVNAELEPVEIEIRYYTLTAVTGKKFIVEMLVNGDLKTLTLEDKEFHEYRRMNFHILAFGDYAPNQSLPFFISDLQIMAM